MKKVLVLGASGAMGRYVVPELARMGYAVDAVSLDAPAKVKAGESTRLNATFAQAEDDGSLFAGRATLALPEFFV